MSNFKTTLIEKYHKKIENNQNDRFLFWEHCYGFFYTNKEALIKSSDEKLFDYAALMLFAYLSSWGMLRNSFLMNYDYKIHIPLIRDLVQNHNVLWSDFENITWEKLKDADQKIFDYYSDLKKENKVFDNVSPTLRTKILLGIFGCIPAYDRFFKQGLGTTDINQQFGETSYGQLVQFYRENKEHFPQFKLTNFKDIEYPPMKLIDMYFWELGRQSPNKSM